MVNIFERASTAPQRRRPNLILHCGAHAVVLGQVATVTTPGNKGQQI